MVNIMKLGSSLCVCLLLVVCLGLASSATYDLPNVPDRPKAKMSSALAREIPSPSFAPLVYMRVNVYLVEGCSTAEDLQPYLYEVFYERDGIVEAEVRADDLLLVSQMPFVEYVDFPRMVTLSADRGDGSRPNEMDLAQEEKPSKMSTNFLRELPSPSFSSLVYMIVDVYLREDEFSKVDELNPYVSNITYRDEGVLEARVRADKLPYIVQMPFVSYVDFPLMQHNERRVSSEAVDCTVDPMGICPFKNENITGKGVTIAVLDNEFYYDNETAKELPEDFVLISNTSYTKHEVHGIACAELISDVSPDVKLYLVDTGKTEFDFINAIQTLTKIDPKVDVVSCSVEFLFGFFEGEDDACRHVQEITSKGAIWINAAGNGAQRHWKGEFEDPDEDGLNNFTPEDESINVTLEKAELIILWLSWEDDWIRASQDYDLRLDYPHGGYSVSDNPQKGYRGHKPMETLSMFAPEDGVYQIKIKKYDPAAKDVTLNLFSSSDLDEYIVPNSSVGVLACCRDVIAVGAVDASTMTIEPFSSRGPTGDGRLKPEIVAPNNVTTSSYYSDKFTGTSASAPYVAGCTALIMEMIGEDGDVDVGEVLMGSAMDLGPLGPDNAYGYGLINLKKLEDLLP